MSSEQAYQQALQQTLQQAVSHHQAGQLQEAENLYRAVLLAQPQHPEANHKLGNLLVEMQQPAAGLPHLEAALAAKPESEHYWLSYIDTLIKAGQADVARHALALGRKHGLQGEAVEMLAARLADSRQVAEQSGMEQQHTVETIPTASPATPRVERKRSKPAKSAGKPAPRVRGGREPSPQEVNALVGMFNQGRYSEG
ncbi:MAG: hypothetical protein NTY41_15390 [Proteobacteria bacterium]|nr:hypothetical protein [Pseudomonadota bacterium]